MSLYHDVDLLSTSELLTLPPVSYLLERYIPEEGLVGLYGAPENGKSFIALAWAMCISQGMPWLRFKTKRAPVVYIAAEGGRGIQSRVRAFMHKHGLKDLPGMYFLLNPLYVREEGVVERFLDELASHDDNPNPHDENGGIWPGLIVLDTLSRSFGGGEENASADMGAFVDSVTELAAQRRMAALVIHHKNATGTRERGNTAFRGACDSMFAAQTERDKEGRILHIELSNDKQKDDERVPTIWLQPELVTPDGGKVSIVLNEMPTPPPPKEKGKGRPTSMRPADMLSVLGAAPEGLTREEWRLACLVDKALFRKRLQRLREDSEIYEENGRFFRMPTNTDLAGVEEA